MTAPHGDRHTELALRLNDVASHIARVATSVGRDPQDIELVPVTKFHPVDDLEVLASCGVRVVGESREQEARDKHYHLHASGRRLAIDMIGQIQSKKTNHIARWAHRVHTVDRVKIARGLDNGMKRAIDAGERIGVENNVSRLPTFIQWSVDGDPARGGASEKELDDIADAVSSSEYLTLEGLMVVPPRDKNPAQVFDYAAELSDLLYRKHGGHGGLSAGMSNDIDSAIAAGSTVVRVGTAILGSRPVTL